MTTALETTARWRAVAAETGAADRAAAEAGIQLAYWQAGLPAPERVIWTGSPLEAAATAMRMVAQGETGRCVRDAVRTRPWAAERQRRHTALGPVGWAERWALTGGQLWDATASLADRIRTGVVEALAEEPEDAAAVRLVLLDAVLGQQDAAWLAAFDDEAGTLEGVSAVARNAGWWWPYERVVVIAERPVELHRDEAGRLDRGDGPALTFPDGFALYAWRGMPVPAAFLAGLAGLTPDRIRTEENAELRRVMLEYYGYDRYLAESGARPLARDETGILWRIDLADDESVAMVEVVNSTPEPDGTHRTYWLRVPPATTTAREGVAWTFGLDAEGYAPERQT